MNERREEKKTAIFKHFCVNVIKVTTENAWKKSAFYLSTDMGVQMGTHFFHHKNEYAKPKTHTHTQTDKHWTSNQKPRIIL